jgi:hypothetical protein
VSGFDLDPASQGELMRAVVAALFQRYVPDTSSEAVAARLAELPPFLRGAVERNRALRPDGHTSEQLAEWHELAAAKHRSQPGTPPCAAEVMLVVNSVREWVERGG